MVRTSNSVFSRLKTNVRLNESHRFFSSFSLSIRKYCNDIDTMYNRPLFYFEKYTRIHTYLELVQIIKFGYLIENNIQAPK